MKYWKLKDKMLIAEFKFKNQRELAGFVLKIARQSDAVAHHCDMEIYECSKLKLKLTTHQVNDITEKDYQLAEWIEYLIKTDSFLNK